MHIAFLGNFTPPHSTESHHRVTWEKLGHTVVSVQENKATASQFLDACTGVDLVQVTHTHGWGPHDGTMEKAMAQVKAWGIPTMSAHLDLYWGLNIWDKREDRIGYTWDWKVDYFFSTDGGHEDFYKKRGVNHRWKRPGVVEYACIKGTPQSQFACDVAFCGSINYHPEYPFRPKLVQALQQRYGSRFRVFQGVREKALNDLYASVKILIGDHCFAGVSNYWSDRAPETAGRGGFMLYPETPGLCIPFVTYRPQGLDDLFAKIDWYLVHDQEREQSRNLCMDHVKNHDTYTVILQEILKEMNLG